MSNPNHPTNTATPAFTRAVLDWFDQHGRKTLPWQLNRNPYRIWLSEIMLQQTQVNTVIPYYQRFLDRFPDISSLARAHHDQVMNSWAGLGYYARARNLHKAAKIICENHNGLFPENFEDVLALPGIGRSTAGAILAFSNGQRHPILDGNVKRVLTRFFAIPGSPSKKSVENRLWDLADRLTPENRIADYTQAVMDLGATVCTRSKPLCQNCPVAEHCEALRQDAIHRYPEPKVRSARKQKTTRMLIIEDLEQQILLVKRPPAGIWGGLWSLPQIDQPETDAGQWSMDNLGLAITVETEMTSLRHGFTHFDLTIRPIVCRPQSNSSMIMDADYFLWYNPQTDIGAGIPAAVEHLFKHLIQNQD
jgi:A/G-specific adenine glycosylase